MGAFCRKMAAVSMMRRYCAINRLIVLISVLIYYGIYSCDCHLKDLMLLFFFVALNSCSVPA